MAESKKSQTSFLDFNASWITMVIFIVYLGGMIFLQRFVFNSIFSSGFNYYVFIIVSFLVGIILSLAVYNTGKIIGAKFSGYKVCYAKFLGFSFDYVTKEKVSFRLSEIGDMALKFTPKDDDIKKNPRPIFFSGLIAEGILFVILLALFLILGLKGEATVGSFIGYMSLFAGIYGLIMVLYEFIPFRQDKPTDFFNLATTKSEEEKECYNIYAINFKRELTGEDFLVPDYSEYNTYYPVHCLYYIYLKHLYANELEKAALTLEKMKANLKKYDEDERYVCQMEAMYLRYLIDDVAGADKVYLSLKSDDKFNITHPDNLSDYRTSIAVFHHISKDKEAYNKAVKEFNKKLESYVQSERILKEKELFENMQKSIETSK